MPWWVGLLIALAGCDEVFGLDRGTDARVDGLPPVPIRPFIVQPDADPDGDSIPTSMDLCPQIHNNMLGADDDTDGDGVGDRCDPAPMVPGDCLALFDTFDSTLRAPEWKTSGADAVQSAGVLQLPLSEEIVLYLDLSLPLTSISVGGYLPEEGSGRRAVQVLFDHTRDSEVTGQACGVEDDGGGMPSKVALVNVDRGTDIEIGLSPLDDTIVGPNSSIWLGWNDQNPLTETSYLGRCRGGLSTPAGHEVMTDVAAVPPMADRIAIRIQNVAFDIGGVIGYGTFCQP